MSCRHSIEFIKIHLSAWGCDSVMGCLPLLSKWVHALTEKQLFFNCLRLFKVVTKYVLCFLVSFSSYVKSVYVIFPFFSLL